MHFVCAVILNILEKPVSWNFERKFFLTSKMLPVRNYLLEKENILVYPDKRGFSWHAKNGEKKNLWRYRVKVLLSMTQHNFRTTTRLEPNLFSGHFDKGRTVLASRYTHSSCARMTRGAKTGYTTSLTSVTSPTPGRLIAHTQQVFDTISSEVFLFSPIFACQEKPPLSG